MEEQKINEDLFKVFEFQVARVPIIEEQPQKNKILIIMDLSIRIKYMYIFYSHFFLYSVQLILFVAFL